MTFARPLDAPLVLETEYMPAPAALAPSEQRARAIALLAGPATLPVLAARAAVALTPPPPPDRQAVPLLQVAGTATQKGLVTIRKSEGSNWSIESTGLVRVYLRQRGASRQETYRFGDDILSLTIAPDSRREERPLQIDGAELVTAVDCCGRDRCLYRFRMQGGDDHVLPIRLPAGATIDEVAIAGRSLAGGIVPCDDRRRKHGLRDPSSDRFGMATNRNCLLRSHVYLVVCLAPDTAAAGIARGDFDDANHLAARAGYDAAIDQRFVALARRADPRSIGTRSLAFGHHGRFRRRNARAFRRR